MLVAILDHLTRLVLASAELASGAVARFFEEPEREREALAIWDRLGRG